MKNKTGIISGTILLLAFPLLAFAQPGRVAPVGVSNIVEKELSTGQTFIGTVMPSRMSSIGSAIDGRVEIFHVNEGDFVKKKAPLAQLLTKTISLELEAAEAELKLREHELTELENGSREDEIKKAKATEAAARAMANYEKNRRVRIEKLFERNVVNQDDFDLRIAESTRADNLLKEAEASLKLAVEGPRKEKISQANAKVLIQKAVVEKLKDQIKKYTIKAPFDGFVVKEHTEIGEWVDRGGLVAEVIALDVVEIEAQVLSSHVSFIKLNSDVRVEIPAIPNKVFTGQVVRIIPQADVRSRTFPVKIRVKNVIDENGPLLKSGMLARVMLPTGPKERSFLVPKDALVLGSGSPMVFVITDAENDGKTVKPVTVQLGVADGRLIQVTGQFTKSDQVVVRGNERLRPKMAVVVSEVLDPEAAPESKAIIKD